MSFLSYLINGISLGSVYAIIALGYTMVYGIAKMLNFAHGDVIMVGGYVAFTLHLGGSHPPLAGSAAIVVCTVLGVVIETIAYRPLLEAASLLAVLITAIGVSYFPAERGAADLSVPTQSPSSLWSAYRIFKLAGGALTISGRPSSPSQAVSSS